VANPVGKEGKARGAASDSRRSHHGDRIAASISMSYVNVEGQRAGANDIAITWARPVTGSASRLYFFADGLPQLQTQRPSRNNQPPIIPAITGDIISSRKLEIAAASNPNYLGARCWVPAL